MQGLATEERGCCRMSESSQLGVRQEREEPEWRGPQQRKAAQMNPDLLSQQFSLP